MNGGPYAGTFRQYPNEEEAHVRLAPLLDAWLDGELDAVQAAEVSAHAETCPRCRRYADDIRAIRAAFPDPEEVDVPEGFADAILSRLPVQDSVEPVEPRGVESAEVRRLPPMPMARTWSRWKRWRNIAVPLAACVALVLLVRGVGFHPARSGEASGNSAAFQEAAVDADGGAFGVLSESDDAVTEEAAEETPDDAAALVPETASLEKTVDAPESAEEPEPAPAGSLAGDLSRYVTSAVQGGGETSPAEDAADEEPPQSAEQIVGSAQAGGALQRTAPAGAASDRAEPSEERNSLSVTAADAPPDREPETDSPTEESGMDTYTAAVENEAVSDTTTGNEAVSDAPITGTSPDTVAMTTETETEADSPTTETVPEGSPSNRAAAPSDPVDEEETAEEFDAGGESADASETETIPVLILPADAAPLLAGQVPFRETGRGLWYALPEAEANALRDALKQEVFSQGWSPDAATLSEAFDGVVPEELAADLGAALLVFLAAE